jgi:hypothetical protein
MGEYSCRCRNTPARLTEASNVGAFAHYHARPDLRREDTFALRKRLLRFEHAAAGRQLIASAK